MTQYNDRLSEFAKLIEDFDNQPLSQRLRFVIASRVLLTHTKFIKFDGFVEKKDCFAVTVGEDSYYVYLWKHLDGDVFYIGSGTGDRWVEKWRNAACLKEMDKGDAVVYKVLQGVDKTNALFYEKYLSLCFRKAGVMLTNKDNAFNEKSDEWLDENANRLNNSLTKEVERVLLNKILIDSDFRYAHYKAIEHFLDDCGEHYFSNLRYNVSVK